MLVFGASVSEESLFMMRFRCNPLGLGGCGSEKEKNHVSAALLPHSQALGHARLQRGQELMRQKAPKPKLRRGELPAGRDHFDDIRKWAGDSGGGFQAGVCGFYRA